MRSWPLHLPFSARQASPSAQASTFDSLLLARMSSTFPNAGRLGSVDEAHADIEPGRHPPEEAAEDGGAVLLVGASSISGIAEAVLPPCSCGTV